MTVLPTGVTSIENQEVSFADDEINSSSLSDDIQVLQAPEVGLRPIVKNADSLRDGMITTETEIEWWYTGDATNYYYGGFPVGYIIEEEDNNFFTTKFYTPGTYLVACCGENEEGEFSDWIGFEVTVVAEFNAQTIEDNLTSSTDSKTYSVDIDFTDMDTAAVCIVRTGKSEVQLQITDENGNVIKPYATVYSIPKRWVYIDKPTEDAQICHYNITVTASSFDEESGAFRVIIGNKDDTEAMMGGLENAVDLDVFYDNQNNYIDSTYIPRSDEYWFITSMPSPTVITLLSNNSDLRYKLIDMDTLKVLVDSNDRREMHSGKFTGSFSNVEKACFEAYTGSRKYLVIYSNNPSEGTGVLEQPFRLGAGQPMYGLASKTVYGSSVTVGTSTYSSTSLNTNTSSFPETAVMNEAYLSGVSLTKLNKWRLRPQGASTYKTSSTGKTTLTYNFTPGGSSNTSVKGTWDLGIMLKSGNSSTRCYPSVKFSYYYEYGDITTTITEEDADREHKC